MIERQIDELDAIASLNPSLSFAIRGSKIEYIEETDSDGNPTGVVLTPNVEIIDNSGSLPSREAIAAEIIRLQAEYDSKQYQRQRQPEYPPLADLADAIYWQSQGDESKMTAYLAAVDAVKQKYPKGV